MMLLLIVSPNVRPVLLLALASIAVKIARLPTCLAAESTMSSNSSQDFGGGTLEEAIVGMVHLFREPRNRAFANIVAAGQFGERRALRSATAGLGLLCCRQFRGTAHVLSALLRPVATLGGAGAD